MAPSLLLRKFFPSSRNGSPSSNSSSSQSNSNLQESNYKPFYPEILNSGPDNCDLSPGSPQTTDLDDPCSNQVNSDAPEAPQFSRNTAQSSTVSSKSGTSSSSSAANSAITKRKRTFLPNFKDKLHSSDKTSSIAQTAPKNQGSSLSIRGIQNHTPVSPDRNVQKPPRDPKIGDVVYFGELKGIIRYIGNTHFAPPNAVFCGLELYTASGKNDGAVDGVRYFQCPSKFGLFVAIDRVTFKPAKELVSPKKNSSKQSKLSAPNASQPCISEIKAKTSSLRDTYDQNDIPPLCTDNSRSFSNANLNAGNQSAIAVLRPSKAAPKTPPSATRKFFNSQQFLRSQSVPKLTTAGGANQSNIPCRSRPDVGKHQKSQTDIQRGLYPANNRNASPGRSQTSQLEEAPTLQQQSSNIPNRLERFLRPKSGKGSISKLALGGDSNQNKRNSFSESQNEVSDINALMREKMLQGSIPNTPLSDGSPGSALRQAQYLFTCPSPTPDQILADQNDFGIVSEPFVIESDDPIDLTPEPQTALVTLNSPPLPCDNSGNEPTSPLSSSRDSQVNYINKIPSDDNSQDKIENFLETIPEAENSMANTLDRLADRQSLDSEGSCIPSRRTSPDGSCDNSLDGNYGNRLMLSKVMNISAVPPRKVMSPLKTGNGGRIVLSSDEDHSSDIENEIDRIKAQIHQSALTAAAAAAAKGRPGSPELPRSLTSSCAHLCDQDDTFFDDEQTTIDEILLAEANISITFSSKSEISGPFVSDFYEQSVEHIRSSPVSDYNDAAELKLAAEEDEKIRCSLETAAEICSDVYKQSTFGIGEQIDHDLGSKPHDGREREYEAAVGSADNRTPTKQDKLNSLLQDGRRNSSNCLSVRGNSVDEEKASNRQLLQSTATATEREDKLTHTTSNRSILLPCNNDTGIANTNASVSSIGATLEDEDPYVGIKCSPNSRNSSYNSSAVLTPTNRATTAAAVFGSSSIAAPIAAYEGCDPSDEEEADDNYVAFCDASSNALCSGGIKDENNRNDVSSNFVKQKNSAASVLNKKEQQCTAAHYVKKNVSQNFAAVSSLSCSADNGTRYNQQSSYAQQQVQQFKGDSCSDGRYLEYEDAPNELGHEERSRDGSVFGEVLSRGSPLREREDSKRSSSEQNRYSNVELPSPSLIFGSQSQELLTGADNVNQASKAALNASGSKLSNNQLEEADNNSSSSNEKNGSTEVLDTDDEILKNDPAIVRPSPRRLPVANNSKLARPRIKPPRSGITLPIRPLPVYQSASSVTAEEDNSGDNSNMVITAAATSKNPSDNSSSRGSSGMNLRQLSSTAGPPPLPSRLTKPPQRSVLGGNSNTSKESLKSTANGPSEGKSSSQSSLITHGASKAANQVPDVKHSKLIQPKKLATSNAAANSNQGNQSARGGPPKKASLSTPSTQQSSPQKSKLASPSKATSNISRRSPTVEQKNKNAEVSSNKSSDRKNSAAASGAKKTSKQSQEQQTKPPVANSVTNAAASKRRPSAPVINNKAVASTAAAPEIASPLSSRKKISHNSLAHIGSAHSKPHKTAPQQQASKEALLLEEKNAEIFKLNDQVANQNKVIESASEALSHSNKAVDVFAVIVQHLTQSMEVFSIDHIKHEVKNLQLALVESQTVIDTARSEITSLKLLHTAQLSELHAKHEENLANLKNNLVSQFNERTQDLKRAHEQEIVRLLDQHEKELLLLDSNHQSDIKEIVSNHEARLHDVEQRHNVAIQGLNDTWTQDITSTQQISSQTIQKLRDQLMRAENENQDLQRKIRELEVYMGQTHGGNQWRKGFFEPEADGRPRTKSVPDTPVSAEWMPQELESLRCVLEMRDEEIHKLRREMNDANALRESLLYKEEEMSGLKLKIESLQASLEFKSEVEKDLRTKLDDQGQQLDEEKKQRHRLTLENDKLSFKVNHLVENLNSSMSGERCQSAEPQIRVGRSSSLRSSKGRPTSLIGMNQSNSSLNTSAVSPRDVVSPINTRQTSLPRSTPDDIIEEDFADRLDSTSSADDPNPSDPIKKPRRQKSLAFTVPL